MFDWEGLIQMDGSGVVFWEGARETENYASDQTCQQSPHHQPVTAETGPIHCSFTRVGKPAFRHCMLECAKICWVWQAQRRGLGTTTRAVSVSDPPRARCLDAYTLSKARNISS